MSEHNVQTDGFMTSERIQLQTDVVTEEEEWVGPERVLGSQADGRSMYGRRGTATMLYVPKAIYGEQADASWDGRRGRLGVATMYGGRVYEVRDLVSEEPSYGQGLLLSGFSAGKVQMAIVDS